MPVPILYSFRRCPYAMRARLALRISEISCELREVKLSAKPEALSLASPKATVPVMVLPDGEVIDQSIDIMRHALSRHDPEGWLDGDDPALICANDGQFKHALDRYKYPERHDTDALIHRAAGLDFLNALEGRLAATPFLCGATRGLADAAVVPFVRQFAAVDTEWFERQRVDHVKAWLSTYLASTLFTQIMLRVKPWVPGDAPVFWPAPAHPLDRRPDDLSW